MDDFSAACGPIKKKLWMMLPHHVLNLTKFHECPTMYGNLAPKKLHHWLSRVQIPLHTKFQVPIASPWPRRVTCGSLTWPSLMEPGLISEVEVNWATFMEYIWIYLEFTFLKIMDIACHRLRRIVTCIGPNQKNQPNLDLYLVRRYKICHFPIVVLYLYQSEPKEPT